MKSQEEILVKMRGPGDFFGFDRQVLVDYLDYEHAKEFLLPSIKPEDWKVKSEADAVRGLSDYMIFAWGKVDDHRGLSASRSVTKCAAWAWLLGKDAVAEQALDDANYPMYGAPALKLICEAFGLPIPGDEPLQRMMRGEPCHYYCDQGCVPRDD